MTTLDTEKAKIASKDSEISRTEKIIIGVLGAIICFLIVGFIVYVINMKKMQEPPKEQLAFSEYNNVVEILIPGKEPIKKTYIIGTDGTTKKNYFLPPNLGAYPEWSADGQWIVSTVRYTVNNFWQSDIYVMRADGSQRTRIPAPKNSFSPTWSPDGKWIAYYYKEPYTWGDKGVILTNVACVLGLEVCASASVNLNLKVSHAETPSLDWSPDGKKLAYTGEVGDPDRLIGHTLIYDINKKNPPIDLTPSSHRVNAPSWSPDGTQILNLCVDEKKGAPTSYNICVVNSDGSNLTYFNLPSKLNYISTPKWSPNGQKIIFHAQITTEGFANNGFCWQNCYFPEALFIMNADGSKLTRINVGDHEIINWFTWYP